MANQAFRLPNTPVFGETNGGNSDPTRRFGVFEVNLRAGELRRNGVKVKLQEQPFQVLAELIERPGQIVTREQLRNRLWSADTYVDFDHGLNAAIRRLRDALGDSAENPTFVETVARRGYRFLAPVSGIPQDGSVPLEAEPSTVTLTPPAHHRHRHGWIAALGSSIVLVLLGLAIGFRIAPHSPTLDRTTRLTANPTGDPIRAAAISHDGRHLAFSDETGFYVRQINSGETHAIALPEGTRASGISWAPDNDHMILALAGTGRSPSLWEISVLGGGARKIIDEGSQPAVSPDGKQIAFLAGPPLHQRIWLAGISGEAPRELLGEDGDLFGTISWSPDGGKIAFTTARITYGYGTKGRIAVAELNQSLLTGQQLRPRTVLSVTGMEAPMVWAPDGRLIYTVEEQRPRQEDSNLWSVQLNKQMKPTGAPVRLTNDQGTVFSVTASSDSNRITYIKGIPQPDVYVAKIASSGVLEEPRRLTLDDRRDFPYDWTPDNKSVIFTSDRTGEFAIYRQAIDESLPEMLIAGSPQWVLPRLSPDGSHVLYLSSPNWSDSNYQVPLMSVPLAGGPSRELAKGKWIGNLHCARSPATVCVYSVINGVGLTFFKFDPSQGGGTQFLQIKDDLAQAYNWTLSPDGTTLAIAKGKWIDEEPRIRLVSLEGRPDRWLTIQGWPGVRSIDWAADSKSLWAPTPGDKDNALLRIDLQGNTRVAWRPKNVGVSWAIPSRDGKLLALHVHSSSANVWMLER